VVPFASALDHRRCQLPFLAAPELPELVVLRKNTSCGSAMRLAFTSLRLASARHRCAPCLVDPEVVVLLDRQIPLRPLQELLEHLDRPTAKPFSEHLLSGLPRFHHRPESASGS
jgi:hypothetical protein